MTPLPHSSQLNAALAKLVSVAVKSNKQSIASLASSDRMKQLYRSCCAIDAILDELDDGRMRPSLQAARSIVIQLPILLLFSFPDNALVELRRFLEIVFWNIYFHDHPIEWRCFSQDPASGFSREVERPISFCAHRELGFYVNYSQELFSDEPSKIAVEAVVECQSVIRDLNAKVHAAALARTRRRQVKFTVCSYTEAKYLCDKSLKVFSSAALILCAAHRKRFDRFGPVARAYFDLLIGPKMAKRVRSGRFGLIV